VPGDGSADDRWQTLTTALALAAVEVPSRGYSPQITAARELVGFSIDPKRG